MSTRNFDRIKAGPCLVKYNSVEIGHTQDGVTVNYEPELRERVVDEFGNTVVDLVMVGEMFSVTMRITQYELANLQIAYPSGLDGTTYLGIGRKPGFLLSSVAQELLIHPAEDAWATTSFDVTLWKAVVNSPVEIGFNSEGDRVFEVTFVALVDDTKVDGRLLGQLGSSV